MYTHRINPDNGKSRYVEVPHSSRSKLTIKAFTKFLRILTQKFSKGIWLNLMFVCMKKLLKEKSGS